MICVLIPVTKFIIFKKKHKTFRGSHFPFSYFSCVYTCCHPPLLSFYSPLNPRSSYFPHLSSEMALVKVTVVPCCQIQWPILSVRDAQPVPSSWSFTWLPRFGSSSVLASLLLALTSKRSCTLGFGPQILSFFCLPSHLT